MSPNNTLPCSALSFSKRYNQCRFITLQKERGRSITREGICKLIVIYLNWHFMGYVARYADKLSEHILRNNYFIPPLQLLFTIRSPVPCTTADFLQLLVYPLAFTLHLNYLSVNNVEYTRGTQK
jgi:hypothetical protein